MRFLKTLSAAAMMLTSAATFASQYYHPVTGELIFDENSVEFSSACASSEVSFNEGSLDLIYNGFNAFAGTDPSKTCLFKIDVNVPSGWKVVVSTEAAVGGNYVGPAIASLEHTVAGKTRQAAFKHLTEAGSFTINQSLKEIGSSACGETMTLKTVANIVVLSEGSFINLNSGSLNGSTTALRYFWDWTPC